MTTKVLIAGKNGMVGSSLVRLYDSNSNFDVIAPSRHELDLLDRNLVFDFMHRVKPDLVIDAAARVGGIVDNRSYPVDFLSINLQIQTNLMDAAAAERVLFNDRSFGGNKFCLCSRQNCRYTINSSLSRSIWI